MSNWENINPTVNAEAEFFEILNDFGDPLEILREGISNSVDAKATWIKITFSVEEIDGAKRLVTKMEDNGNGMTKEILARDFWGLGYSTSRERKGTIGEKGHGAKIYLRSEKVTVRTQSEQGAFLSICEWPLRSLSQKKLHQPKMQPIDNFLPHSGTEITIVGYNDNQRTKFVQNIVKDYLLWFTKVGSIERIFGIDELAGFKVHLKCLNYDEHELIEFGHLFPDDNTDINRLFEEHGAAAADLYVKRNVWQDQRLVDHPEVTFDAVISVEGDEIKRKYNPMIRDRSRSDTGRYRAGDRYGIWLCKDYIPITRVNEWISGFGSGSNAFILLHGFVNCQSLKLTANRGDIANTDPKILDELKTIVQKLINEVDNDLSNNGIYTLRGWQEESRTIQQEKTEFQKRLKALKKRKTARLNNCLLIEPNNESELFGIFNTIYALHPELFDFEPLDYNTTRGVDIIARNKSPNMITEGEHSYIELKYMLQAKKFNHAFTYLRWIVCWDFDKAIAVKSELSGIEDTDVRQLHSSTDNEGHPGYSLVNVLRGNNIQVIRLKEFLKNKLELEFKPEH